MLSFKQTIAAILLTAGFMMPVLAFDAQARILPDCEPLPVDPARRCGVSDLFDLLANIFNFLLGLAAIVFILMIIVSGIRYMLIAVAEFEPDETAASALESAKLGLQRAIVGFIIVLLAFLIINTLLVILGVPAGFFGAAGIPQLENFVPAPPKKAP